MKRSVNVVAFAATMAVLLTAAPAVAADEDKAPVRRVSYSDLDLTEANDQRRLRWRLQTAATELCTTDQFDRPVPRTMLGLRGCTRGILAPLEPRVARLFATVQLVSAEGRAPSTAITSLALSR